MISTPPPVIFLTKKVPIDNPVTWSILSRSSSDPEIIVLIIKSEIIIDE